MSRAPSIRKNSAVLTEVGAATLIVLAMLWLVPYGAEMCDEPIFFAGAQRFFLGDRLFIDDSGIGQMVYAMLMPVFRLCVWLNGGKEGILLTSRYLNFLFSLGVVGFLFSGLRKHLPRRDAVLISLLVFVAFPQGTVSFPNFSYNSLAAAFSLLLLGLTLHELAAGSHRRSLDALAVLFATLCSFAHPATLPAMAVYLGLRFLRGSSLRTARENIFFSAVVVLGTLLIAYSSLSLRQVVPVLHGVLQKWGTITQGHTTGMILIAAASVAALGLAQWQPQRFHLVFLASVPVLMFRHQQLTRSTMVMVMLFWSSQGLFWLFKRFSPDPRVRAALIELGIPSVLAALALATFSSDSLGSPLNGLAPLFVLSTWVSLRMTTDRQWRGISEKAIAHGFLGLMILGLFASRCVPYLDVPVWKETRPVKYGVSKGLRTDSARASYIERAHDTISHFTAERGSVLVYRLPVYFYLESSQRPVSSNMYQCYETDAQCLAAYQRKKESTCLLVRGLSGKAQPTAFDDELARSYATITRIDDYEIARRQTRECEPGLRAADR